MGSRHRRTLEAVFRDPVSATLVWMEVEKMLVHYGASIIEGRGSRISVELEGQTADFPSPTSPEGSEAVPDPGGARATHPGRRDTMSMTYKGYTGTIEYSAEDRCFHGRVIGITDIVSFEGTSVEELEADFQAGVDSYLAGCAARGMEPQRPYSGRFVLRLSAETHRDASLAARSARASMNAWIVGAIQMRLDAEKAARSPTVEERLPDAAGG